MVLWSKLLVRVFGTLVGNSRVLFPVYRARRNLWNLMIR